MPVNAPPEMTTRNYNAILNMFGVGALAQYADNKDKSQKFAEKMREERQKLGSKMTSALMEELPRQGYQVELIDRIPGTAGDPEDIDFTQARVSGPILHVWYFDVGLHSPRWRIAYEPKINVAAKLAYPLDEHYPYDEWLYYGIDSRGEDYWSIPSDPSHRFTSFEAIIDKPEDVVAAFDAGIQAIARHLAKEFRRRVP